MTGKGSCPESDFCCGQIVITKISNYIVEVAGSVPVCTSVCLSRLAEKER